MNKTINKKKIDALFVLFEGIDDTIFDAQVATHVREVKKNKINFEIWAFATNNSLFVKSQRRKEYAEKLAGCKIRLFRGVYSYIPFSDFLNSLWFFVIYLFLRPSAKFIHARSNYSASVCGYFLRILNYSLIWDCRGDTLAEFDNAFKPSNPIFILIKWIYKVSIRWQILHAAQTCSFAIFVSEELREKYKGLISESKTVIIPSSASSHFFYFSKNARVDTRKRLGITEKEVVLLYSGGMVKYQNFPYYVSYFKELCLKNPNLKLLIVTPFVDKAIIHMSSLNPENFIVLSARFDEMNDYYNAADYGLLFRVDNSINKVASPTKFAEYALVGLPVIMNESVPQSVRLARLFGGYVDYKEALSNGISLQYEDERRLRISNAAKDLISKETIIQKYVNLYENIINNVVL